MSTLVEVTNKKLTILHRQWFKVTHTRNGFNPHDRDWETGKTRVSFDFRVVPGFAYDPECTLETCTTKSRFVVGGYYEKITREETPYMYDAEENAKRGAAC